MTDTLLTRPIVSAARVVLRGFDAVLFGFGLLESARRVLLERTREERRDRADDRGRRMPTSAVPATPREKPRPRPPRRPRTYPGDVEVTTPVGTTGAGPAHNPDTAEADLQQRGTEDIVEPSTAKRLRKEAERMRRAAEPRLSD
jgi:hypothetical protein